MYVSPTGDRSMVDGGGPATVDVVELVVLVEVVELVVGPATLVLVVVATTVVVVRPPLPQRQSGGHWPGHAPSAPTSQSSVVGSRTPSPHTPGQVQSFSHAPWH